MNVRANIILNTLLHEGFAQTSDIHQNGEVSKQTLRKELVQMVEEKLIQYRVLPTKSIGTGERVYSLSDLGLKSLGKTRGEIKRYKKQLSRIHHLHMRHFLKNRQIEKLMNACVKKSGYQIESCNEFSDTQNWLYVKLKNHIIRSDGHFRILENGNERVSLKVEIDMSTEAVNVLMDKFEAYHAFAESELVKEHTKTFPLYVLFTCFEKRIPNILKKLKKTQYENILFLPYEKCNEDIFEKPVMVDNHGNHVSLKDIVEERTPILEFDNLITSQAFLEQRYTFTIKSKFSSHSDAFFPVHLANELWSPECWLRIQKLQDSNIVDKLFALVCITEGKSDEEIGKMLTVYDYFLSQSQLLKRVTETEIYGCMVVTEDCRLSMVLEILKTLEIRKRTRIIVRENCTEGVLTRPVWITYEGKVVPLIYNKKR